MSSCVAALVSDSRMLPCRPVALPRITHLPYKLIARAAVGMVIPMGIPMGMGMGRVWRL